MSINVAARNPLFGVTIATQRLALTINPSDIAGSLVEISTSRRIGDAGTFQLVLVYRKPPAKFQTDIIVESWRDIIEPMDYVEIALYPDGPLTVGPNQGGEVIMRGFVDTVGVTIDISSGTPTRRVVVVGRDYTKILLTHQLYYPTADDGTQNEIIAKIEQGLAVLVKNKNLALSFILVNTTSGVPSPTGIPSGAVEKKADIPFGYTATQVLQIFNDFFFQPELQKIFSTFQGAGIAPPVVFTPDGITADVLDSNLQAFDPIIDSNTVQPFKVLAELFEDYQHSPWRELFFDDYGPNSYFIYRPAPWLDQAGNLIQLSSTAGMVSLPADPWDIDPADVINVSIGRNDQEVENFIATYSSLFEGFTQAEDSYGAALESLNIQGGNPEIIGLNDVLPTTTPSSINRFGYRRGRHDTPYFDTSNLTGKTITQTTADVGTLREICAAWNSRIVRAMNHNELLESGTLTLKGSVHIHIGHYIRFTDSPTRAPARYYVEGIEHVYRFPVGDQGSGYFTTTLELTRGRGYFAARGQP